MSSLQQFRPLEWQLPLKQNLCIRNNVKMQLLKNTRFREEQSRPTSRQHARSTCVTCRLTAVAKGDREM